MKTLVAGLGLFTALLAGAADARAQTTFTQVGEFAIPEANQGVGVDAKHFYAVDDTMIAKYRKDGSFVARANYATIGIIHLDSATVIDGKIYCSHSNYRYFPMTSSIEVFDADTLEHMGSHSIGIRLGSLTWLDKHDGHWWGTFANYDRTGRLPNGTNVDLPYGTKYNSTLVKFDRDWQVLEGWIFPVALLDKFEEMSNSGGSWGPDGSLYLTGHDPAEVYKIRFPRAGSLLQVEETIPANIRGQGVAWDRSRPGTFFGIIRATSAEEAQGITNKVVVFQTNVSKRPRSWRASPLAFTP
jgi:hypothetical protein